VTDPKSYLARVVTHLAIDALRKRKLMEQTYVGAWLPEPVPTAAGRPSPLGPLEAVEQRESVSIATLHLLERLSAAQRAVFVLRTAFGLTFREISEAVGRSPDDCRQLYRRAGARLGSDARRRRVDVVTHERMLNAFLAAVREGDLDGLIRLLAEDVTVWSDGGGRTRAARRPIVGAGNASRFLTALFGPHRLLRFDLVEVNGQQAAVIRENCAPQVLALTVAPKISEVFIMSNPDKLRLVTQTP
jgi:RNA polymerase sigma-70 factor (ECF subfamily)